MKSFKTLALLMFMGMSMLSMSQTEASLPFREISEYPESYTANSVTARLIESLGFRYYWATEGLTQTDLDHQITEGSRSAKATLVHIYDLSLIVRNSAERKENDRGDNSGLSYQELRIGTLNNLKIAHGIIAAAESLDTFQITFGTAEFPFWNQINGPIADALWHCGQMAMMRRASGNPISPDVNHFLGKVKD
jgi:hypothetical protein